MFLGAELGAQPERNAIVAPASWLLRVSGWRAEKSLAAIGAFPPLSSRLLSAVDGVGAEAAASRTRRGHASTLGRLMRSVSRLVLRPPMGVPVEKCEGDSDRERNKGLPVRFAYVKALASMAAA